MYSAAVFGFVANITGTKIARHHRAWYADPSNLDHRGAVGADP